MCTWTRQPQERPGSYQFDGQLYVTIGVKHEVPIEEILFIYQDVRAFAESGNADYLQVYNDRYGRKIYCIDQLSQEEIWSGKFGNEDNYLTILFPEEY